MCPPQRREMEGIRIKKCKILHINDGSAVVRTNGNFHFMEEYVWAEETVQSYLREGYEVKQMIPTLTPARLDGGVAFYDTGFTIYLERDVEEDEEELDLEDPDVETLDVEDLDEGLL